MIKEIKEIIDLKLKWKIRIKENHNLTQKKIMKKTII
jgi:hypothetical protein